MSLANYLLLAGGGLYALLGAYASLITGHGFPRRYQYAAPGD